MYCDIILKKSTFKALDIRINNSVLSDFCSYI